MAAPIRAKYSKGANETGEYLLYALMYPIQVKTDAIPANKNINQSDPSGEI